jgi:hypothetical protein
MNAGKKYQVRGKEESSIFLIWQELYANLRKNSKCIFIIFDTGIC